MVDGETYECVKSFCYLRDTHDGDGGADLAASTKRIQPARGRCATDCAKCIHLFPPLWRPGHPFLGSQPCVPAVWLALRLLLAGDIESNPGLEL